MLLIAIALAVGLGGLSSTCLASPGNEIASAKPVEFLKVASPGFAEMAGVVVDGSLDETAWSHACLIGDLLQIEPHKGALPSESTQVFVLYDRQNLYVAAHCFDDPSKIRADTKIRDHDRATLDDAIYILLSPFNDKASGYCFGVNAVGTQRDARVLEDGLRYDGNWDSIWESAVRITETGWTVEISIPFASIRYDKSTKTWGFNFNRVVTRKTETISWVPVSSVLRVSELGQLGIDTERIDYRIAGEKRFRFQPYLVTDATDVKSDVGIGDVSFRVSEKAVLQGTVNPDYAHIEADVDQFSLDKLPIYLAEKRPFFLEEQLLFETPVSLMYTRSMGDIAGGAKFTGRIRKTDFGVLGVVLDDSSSGSDSFNPAVLATRIKSTFGLGSIGFLGIANRHPSNQVANVDAYVSLPWKLYSSFQVAESWKDSNPSKILHYIGVTRSPSTGVRFYLAHEHIPSDFEDVRAFLWMTDVASTRCQVMYRSVPNRWGILYATPLLEYTHWDTDGGDPIRRYGCGGLELDFVNNTSLSSYVTQERRWWGEERYDNRLYTVEASYSPGGTEGVWLSHTWGDYYGGFLHYPTANLAYTFLNRITAILDLSCQFMRQGGETSDEMIAALTASAEVLPKLNFRAFAQWTELSDELQANYLLTYTFFTGSHIYLVLNERRDTDNSAANGLHDEVDRKALFKVSYEFSF